MCTGAEGAGPPLPLDAELALDSSRSPGPKKASTTGSSTTLAAELARAPWRRWSFVARTWCEAKQSVNHGPSKDYNLMELTLCRNLGRILKSKDLSQTRSATTSATAETPTATAKEAPRVFVSLRRVDPNIAAGRFLEDKMWMGWEKGGNGGNWTKNE